MFPSDRPTLDRAVALALASALGLGLWPVSVAQAQPPRDKQRQDLMDQLGMPKAKPKPEPPPDTSDGDSNDGDSSDGDSSGDEHDPDPSETTDPAEAEGETGGGAARITYAGKIRKQLERDCKSCHASDAVAGKTRFVITGDFNADYRSAKRLVSTSQPKSSALLTKANGQSHGGGTNYPDKSLKSRTLLEWIEGGAMRGGGGKSTAPAPAPETGGAKTGGAKTGGAKTGGAKTGGAKTKTGGASTQAPAEPEPSSEDPEPSWVEASPETEAAPVIAYAPISHEILQRRCASCHGEGQFASTTALVLSGDPARDYVEVRALVSPEDPEASRLLIEGRGEGHAGGAALDTASADYGELLAWIEAGAYGPTAKDVPKPGAEPEPSTGPEPEIDATTGASTRAEPGDRLGDGTAVPESTPSRLPFSLPYHLRLNGRFDLSYERRDYKDHPVGPGRNALQTYHHFLFLSRAGADDPFGFNVELITQQFYEFNARFVTRDGRAKFLLKAGKIMVPFGDEPLFHSSYGGKSGFDQELLPVIWSQPGVAMNTHITAGAVSITNDVYAIQGFGLRSADGVLNMQGDASTLDDFRFGVGDRVGLSWAPLSAWYSIQINPLGFDRRLLLQALDFEFWRLQGVPFLQDLVVGFGAMRADVSGGGPELGGPGRDYYHFGSYGKLRYYPVDWLYLQYRWGLKTIDNRRGLYYDSTRADERDGSSHNLTIGATYKGMFAALQLFWNLEKANEQDNDFLRFTVGYAF